MGDRHSLAQRLLALGEVLLVQHRREFLAKLLLEGLRRVRQTLGLKLGLALVLGRGLLVADVEVLLDRLTALERLLEGGEGVRALRERRKSAPSIQPHLWRQLPVCRTRLDQCHISFTILLVR